MKKIIILLLFINLTNTYPQNTVLRADNIIYLDFGVLILGGAGAIGVGINYERMLSDNISLRAGVNISLFAAAVDGDAIASSAISFPVSVNYMTNNKNKFEIGFGGGPQFEINNPIENNVKFLPAFRLGYRYQPVEKSMIYRLGVELPANFYLSFASLGYHF